MWLSSKICGKKNQTKDSLVVVVFDECILIITCLKCYIYVSTLGHALIETTCQYMLDWFGGNVFLLCLLGSQEFKAHNHNQTHP